MFKICDKIKVDTEKDLCFLTDKDKIQFVNKVVESKDATKPIKDQFLHSSDELVNILDQMLQFNPHFRPSASELLKNKIFDEYRKDELEQPPPCKIVIDIDNEQP